MNKTTTYLSILISFLTINFSFAQTAEQLHDSVENILFSDPGLALELSLKEVELAEKGTKSYVDALNDLGTCEYYTDDYDAAELNLTEALKIAEQLDYANGKAAAMFNLGDMYILTGTYGTAIDYLSGSLEIYELIKDNSGTSDCLNGIGIIYTEQADYEKALEYFNRALTVGTEITIGDTYTYMAQLFQEMESWSDAEKYASLGLESGTKNEDGYITSACADVLGFVNYKYRNYTKALTYFKEAVDIKVDLEDLQGQAATLLMMGSLYKDLDSLKKAKLLFSQAYSYSSEIGAKDEIRTASSELAKLIANEGQYDSAFHYQNIFIEVNDEIINENAYKNIADMEAKIIAEKKAQEIAILEKEKEYEKQTTQLIIIASIIIVVLLLIGGVIMLKRYQEKKKAHTILENKNEQIISQKEIIEEKNKDILDSIHYAKRIQSAILPPDKLIKEHLKKSFVLYKPKDIVAGDFYWLEHKAGTNLFAAADCTGHGVPGAMVSVVCNNALNRSVREYGLIDPGKILDKTREIVLQEFEKSEEEVKDGMDIALCSLQGNILKYAGANNPLWIIRNEEVIEIKANKQPIGKFDEPKPYTTHTIELQLGDSFYVFSDGFVDQFGGDRSKKFKSTNFKKLLISIQNESMEKQMELINIAFEEWKGEIEQLDDVCVIGVSL